MRKIKSMIMSLILLVCILSGCSSSSSMSITFTVGTGDNIKITLDSTDGIKLRQTDSGFAVSKDDTDILQAFFVEQTVYQQYLEAVATQNGVTVNEEKTENGITYLSYSYNGEAGMENNFLVWIEATNTGVVVASLADLQTAAEAFQRISFSKE